MVETKFKLTLDGAQAVVSGLGQVANKMGDVKGRVDALYAAGGALSAGAFVAMIHSAIEAADHLNDLTKSTSLTVEQLSGLSLVAKMSGTDLDGVAKGVSRMSQEMGKNAERFAQIGIATKDPLRALQQVADIFVAIEDPNKRAAFANAVFGKSWSELAPLLSEGGQRIGELIEKGQRYSSVTKEMAENSDEFNDQLTELQVATTGFKNRLTADMLPGLNEAIGAIKQAYIESGKLQALWVTLGAGGLFLFTDQFASAQVKIQNLKEGISVLEADLDRKRKSRANGGMLDQWLFGESDEKALVDKINGMKASLASLQKPPAAPGEKAKVAAPAGLDTFIGGDDASGKATDFEKLSRAMLKKIEIDQESVRLGRELSEAEKTMIGIRQDARDKVVALTSTELGLLAAYAQQQDGLQGTIRARELLAKADIEAAQAREKSLQTMSDGLEKMRAESAAQQEQNDRLGLSATAIAELDAIKLESQAVTLELMAIKQMDKNLDQAQYDLYKAQAEELRRLAGLKREGAEKGERLEKEKKDADEANKIWDNYQQNLQRGVGDAIYNGLEGKASNVGDLFRSMLRRMIADAAAADVMGVIFGSKTGGSSGGLLAQGIGAIGGLFGGYGNQFGYVEGLSYKGLGGGFAKGGAFTNGVVEEPTLFNIGEMGEGGKPEAIMPLTRGADGSLGVRASGGGGKSITIAPVTNVHVDSRADRAQVAHDMYRIADQKNAELVDQLSRAGMLG